MRGEEESLRDGRGQWTRKLQLEQKGRLLRKTPKVGEGGVQGQPGRETEKKRSMIMYVCMCLNAISETRAW